MERAVNRENRIQCLNRLRRKPRHDNKNETETAAIPIDGSIYPVDVGAVVGWCSVGIGAYFGCGTVCKGYQWR